MYFLDSSGTADAHCGAERPDKVLAAIGNRRMSEENLFQCARIINSYSSSSGECGLVIPQL